MCMNTVKGPIYKLAKMAEKDGGVMPGMFGHGLGKGRVGALSAPCSMRYNCLGIPEFHLTSEEDLYLSRTVQLSPLV